MYSMHLNGNSTIVCFLEKNLVLKIEMRLAAKFIHVFSPHDFILRVGLSCKCVRIGVQTTNIVYCIFGALGTTLTTYEFPSEL